MGRRKKVQPDDPERSARFIETAERIQTEDAEERFEEAMKWISTKKSDKQQAENDKSNQIR